MNEIDDRLRALGVALASVIEKCAATDRKIAAVRKEQVLDDLPAHVSPHWARVEDELPSENENVPVVVHSREINPDCEEVFISADHVNKNGRWVYWGGEDCTKVTHWLKGLELPEVDT